MMISPEVVGLVGTALSFWVEGIALRRGELLVCALRKVVCSRFLLGS